MNHTTLSIDPKAPLHDEVAELYSRCANLGIDKYNFENLLTDECRIKLAGRNVMIINQGEVLAELYRVPALRVPEVEQLTRIAAAFVVWRDEPFILVNTLVIPHGPVTDRAINTVSDVIEHELVHLNQWERGDLIQTANTLTWKGVTYQASDIYLNAIGNSPEEQREAQLFEISKPWEWEAYMAVESSRIKLTQLFGTERPRTKLFP